MKLPDESHVTIEGVRYSLLKDRHHEIGEGFAFVVDEPNKSQECSFITLKRLKALSFLINQK